MANSLVPSTQPMSMTDMLTLASAIAKSGLFGMRSPEQALVLMAIAQAEGRHPVEAARDYDIIQGRPAKKAEAMLRDFIQAGGKVEWHSLTDDLADATFTHPQTGSVRIDWDMQRATTAFGKKEMYQKFPRQMLRSRVVSEGVRTLWPLATSGMYVPEEAVAIPHIGPTLEAEAEVPTPGTREEINASVPMPPPEAPKAPPAERSNEQWTAWLEKLRAACDILRSREEVEEVGRRGTVGDAIATGPEWVQAEISAILAESYKRFSLEEVPTDG